jgi:hypothetical protein
MSTIHLSLTATGVTQIVTFTFEILTAGYENSDRQKGGAVSFRECLPTFEGMQRRFKTATDTHQTTRHHIPEDPNPQTLL